jgi:hypothetical protein
VEGGESVGTSGPFELSPSFLSSGEVIQSDGYLSFCEESDYYTYRKRDFIFKGGIWRGVVQEPEYLKFRKSKSRGLVIGHSDLHTSRLHQLLLRAIGVKKIWGTNLNPIPGFSHPLPLGLSNSDTSSIGHSISSDFETFIEAVSSSNFCQSYSPSLYVNMTAANNSSAREGLLKSLGDSGFDLLVDVPSLSRESMLSYLRKMRETALTPCPEGNGVDTHRLWECLYVGGTPVVLQNSSMASLYSMLPVIVLRSWSEIRDRRRMEELWHESRSKPWQKEALSLSFWTNQMSASFQD